MVEIAASGRAGCKACKLKIAKDTIRMGKRCDGDWGPYYAWYHLNCWKALGPLPPGFEELPDDRKNEVQGFWVVLGIAVS